MTVRHKVYHGSELIVLNAWGTVDLTASKAAIRKIADDPEFQDHYEILMDLQEVDADLSVPEVFELASFVAMPHNELPTRRKIAVVVSGEHEFDLAEFMALCAAHRHAKMRAFRDMSEAVQWLDL